MVLTYFPVTLAPVAVSIAVSVMIVYTLIVCVCGKRGKEKDPELTDIKIQGNSAVQSASSLPHTGDEEHNNITNTSSIKLETDTAITPIDQGTRQNGTLHSRGNSADLTKPDHRHSGTSTGSSPRQATLSRELPDIPIQSRDKGNHSHLPELPPGTRQTNFKQESTTGRGGHSHSQLPDIPKSHTLALEGSSRGGNLRDISLSQRNKSPTIPKTTAESKQPVRLSTEVPVPVFDGQNELDDYDHLTETKCKKMRPRSDYDHVLIEGDQKRIIPAKHVEDPDYAEVKTENIYEGVPDDVTVIPVKSSINNITSVVTQTKNKTSIAIGKAPVKETCVDLPYNKINDESGVKAVKEPPYNKIKDDGIKDVSDPYNTVKDLEDDPYNKVKGEDESEIPMIDALDDIDPYNTVQDTDSVKASRKPPTKTRTEGPNYDPYALLDEDRNVSNQSSITDPYSKVCDTDLSEIDDPYNRVDDSASAGSEIKSVKQGNLAQKDSDPGYSTVNKVSRVEYATVNKVSVRRKAESASNSENGNERLVNGKPQPRYAPDEYSTVNKVRQGKIVIDGEIPGTSQMEDRLAVRHSQPPEEPPRDYDDENNYDDTDVDHYNTVLNVSENRDTNPVTNASATSSVPNTTVVATFTTTVDTYTTTTAATTATTVTTSVTSSISTAAGVNIGPDGTCRKKEPPYTKLSARESLASMNARMASNTYETVADVDNLYATVEGGSGDGVVRPKSQRQSGQALSSNTELYAEIDGPTAPAPPSLDSLHETAKQQSNQRAPGQGHCRTPSGQGHIRTPSDHIRNTTVQGHFRTPSGGKNHIEGQVTLATEEVVDLDSANYRPNAQTPDELEYDPNYETVEEAKSKAKYEEINGSSKMEKKIRAHVYEEVTLTNEARRTRQRVLNLHTYEDITDVKDLEDRNRQSANAEGDKINVADEKFDETKTVDAKAEKSKTLDGRVSKEAGATDGGAGEGEGKGKKSKSNDKSKDKGKDRKKSDSKEKSEKTSKSNKK